MVTINKIEKKIAELEYIKDNVLSKLTTKEMTPIAIENAEDLVRGTIDLLKIISHSLNKKAASMNIEKILEIKED